MRVAKLAHDFVEEIPRRRSTCWELADSHPKAQRRRGLMVGPDWTPVDTMHCTNMLSVKRLSAIG